MIDSIKPIDKGQHGGLTAEPVANKATLIDWRNRIYDNELSLGDRLQAVACAIDLLLSGEPEGKYPPHVIREQGYSMDRRATSWIIHRNSGDIDHTTDPKAADEARMVGFLVENQFPSQHPLSNMSDEDIWHIAGQVARMADGNLSKISQHECVTEIRASFMDPDAGREFIKDSVVALAVPEVLSDELRFILGRPCFMFIGIAQRLRSLGHDIKTSAEDEQAVGIHLALKMYQKHGADWPKHFDAYLNSKVKK